MADERGLSVEEAQLMKLLSYTHTITAEPISAPEALRQPAPPPPAPEAPPAATSGSRLSPLGATALVVGSIVGVGIFNLPSSLAPYGPITLVSMGLTTIGALALAWLFATLARRMPAP